jgi:hypothetical protein
VNFIKYLVIVDGEWFGDVYYVEGFSVEDVITRVYKEIHGEELDGDIQDLQECDIRGRGKYKAYKLDEMNSTSLDGVMVKLLSVMD